MASVVVAGFGERPTRGLSRENEVYGCPLRVSFLYRGGVKKDILSNYIKSAFYSRRPPTSSFVRQQKQPLQPMSHYKRDASSNRDALFGGAGGGGGTSKPSRQPAAATRPVASAASSSAPAPSVVNAYAAGGATESTITPGPSQIFSGKVTPRSNFITTLSGQAKIDKMAEAEDFRLKAKKAMTRGVFSRPDPISAANFYKRAADAYKQCGENRLERLHRIASGDCQMGQDAFATAASEYTRAAELAETSDETLPRKRQECHKLHLDAANAWAQMGEKGRAAESTMKAAFGLIMGDDKTKPIDKASLKSIEEGIESFVPDPLNRKSNFRRSGQSAYFAPNAPDSEAAKREALALAKQNIITTAFAHETLFQVGAELIKRRHFESALYAYGAGTASLEEEGIATVSLSRAYLSETILTLAMGDMVAASKDFQRVHLQRTSYLSSRECALAEDLIRACNDMDLEALDEARSKCGSHRSAMANLDPVLRQLVMDIRVSGRAKKGKGAAKPKPATVEKAPSAGGGAVAATKALPATAAATSLTKKELTGDELQQSLDAGFAEMDDIMNDMGLGDDDDEFDLT